MSTHKESTKPRPRLRKTKPSGMPQPPEYGARPGPSVEQVQMQVQGVRGIMQENVDVMLANIDKTEVLEDKSSALASQAKSFQKTSRAVKKKMWCANMKMNLLIGCVCIIIVLAIVIPVVTSAGSAAGAASTVTGSSESSSASPPPPPAEAGAGRRLSSLLFSGPLLHHSLTETGDIS